MISRDEVLMGRDVEYPLTPELEANLDKLLYALNIFRELYGKPMVVSSGYRPGHYNSDAHGAKHSNHIICLAADFHDPLGEIDQYITLDNEQILASAGLWREAQASTPGWVHLQCVPFKSYQPGNTRSFKP